jgi:hypothetical protein
MDDSASFGEVSQFVIHEIIPMLMDFLISTIRTVFKFSMERVWVTFNGFFFIIRLILIIFGLAYYERC